MGARPVIALADAFHDEAEMYAASLQHEGFDVRIITTSDVAAAARQIHDIAPDAVLTRILPRRFGIELVTQLRRDPRMANRPVLVITSLTYHENELRDAKAAGATEVLLLPQTAEDLAHMIRGYLRHAARRLRRA
jgi:DNA-binding response OmpR family regulator